MRSLIATVVLCCLMLLATILNFIYVNRIADEMTSLVDALPSINDADCAKKTDALCRKWGKNAPFIGLSVGFLTVDKLSEYCETLRSCAEAKDVYGYHAALTLIRDSIDDVRRLEQFSVENLF